MSGKIGAIQLLIIFLLYSRAILLINFIINNLNSVKIDKKQGK